MALVAVLSVLLATDVSGLAAAVTSGAVAFCVAAATVLVAGAVAFWVTVATVLVAGAVAVLVVAGAVLVAEAATEVTVLASAAVVFAGAWTALDAAGALGALAGDDGDGVEVAGFDAGFAAGVTEASVSLATLVAFAPADETAPVIEESPPLALAVAGAARADRTMTAVAAQAALLRRLARNPHDDTSALEAERPVR
jgi:hypothetical protein